jgi:serine protease AprX
MRAQRHRQKLFSHLLSIFAVLFFASQSLHAPQARFASEPMPSLPPVPEREREAPFNHIYTAVLSEGRAVDFSVQELPPSAFSIEPFSHETRKPRISPEHTRPRDKIHPKLQARLATLRPDEAERSQDQRERFIITFRDDVKMPRFPALALDEPADSPANTAAHGRAAELVEEIQQHRAASYARLAAELSQRYGAHVLETFWLINGMVVELPLGAIAALAARPDVLSVEPVQAGELPPQNVNTNDDVDDGRARIVSDPYSDIPLTGGFIGLLDTGVRFTHTLFNNPSHIDLRRDCVNGGADCNTGSNLNPNDDCWNHGTSSAAIITANNNLGNAYRGVTAITLDSFKIYPTSLDATGSCDRTKSGLDRAAAVRGFQAAVAAMDTVIVAEMQGDGNETGSISVAADQAFDAGAVIIAANGNNGPGAGTVNEPANARKVLGVGAFDVASLSQYSLQSRGPTADGRIKPDIQAPTNTETASNASDTALRAPYSGTSGATPYAAGAAALLRDWLNGLDNVPIDPGQVYAQMILSGQTPYPFDNTAGAGRLELPTNGGLAWGKVSVTNGQTINLPLSVAAGTQFDAALWWPESASQQHSDIDLYIVAPSGDVHASSTSTPSVFERARVAAPIVEGTWTIRIRGYSVPTGSQTVYWAMHVR